MTEGGMEQLVAALTQAREAGKPAMITTADLPETPQEAYAVSRAQVGDVAAWKIGGANPWSRKVFDNKEVFFGPLHPHEVFLERDTMPLGGLVAPLAEPEVMLEIADWTTEAPTERFSRMGLGFEIPAAVLPESLKPELLGQIVDRAGAGGLWIGAIQPFDAVALDRELTVQMTHNGGAPTAGSSANVIGSPLGAAAEFLTLARRYDMPVARGQWIATGGLCPAVPVRSGDRLTLRSAWGEIGLDLG